MVVLYCIRKNVYIAGYKIYLKGDKKMGLFTDKAGETLKTFVHLAIVAIIYWAVSRLYSQISDINMAISFVDGRDMESAAFIYIPIASFFWLAVSDIFCSESSSSQRLNALFWVLGEFGLSLYFVFAYFTYNDETKLGYAINTTALQFESILVAINNVLFGKRTFIFVLVFAAVLIYVISSYVEKNETLNFIGAFSAFMIEYFVVLLIFTFNDKMPLKNYLIIYAIAYIIYGILLRIYYKPIEISLASSYENSLIPQFVHYIKDAKNATTIKEVVIAGVSIVMIIVSFFTNKISNLGECFLHILNIEKYTEYTDVNSLQNGYATLLAFIASALALFVSFLISKVTAKGNPFLSKLANYLFTTASQIWVVGTISQKVLTFYSGEDTSVLKNVWNDEKDPLWMKIITEPASRISNQTLSVVWDLIGVLITLLVLLCVGCCIAYGAAAIVYCILFNMLIIFICLFLGNLFDFGWVDSKLGVLVMSLIYSVIVTQVMNGLPKSNPVKLDD